ncbi:MAG: gfo/Idh/MocA family oxidoreductase, partial [Bacteroidota bacterium]|nr:gfo/Idh/MocA family oxidoreductase [Bacteroidota bacterium]
MEKEEKNSRRTFLRTAATGALIAAVAPSAVTAQVKKPEIIPASVKGANDRIRVAVLGVYGRGQSHIEEVMGLQEKSNVEVAVLCDPDMNILQKRANEFEKKYGKKVAIEQDFRRTYDDKTIDAVTLATP